MGDLALVLFFFCMLMVPCYLAARTVRGNNVAGGAGTGVFAMAEVHEDGENCAAPFEPTVDRRALAIQRSREIYYRTGGKAPQPDYGLPTERASASSSPYFSRRAG